MFGLCWKLNLRLLTLLVFMFTLYNFDVFIICAHFGTFSFCEGNPINVNYLQFLCSPKGEAYSRRFVRLSGPLSSKKLLKLLFAFK